MKKLVLNNQNKTGNGRFSYSENDVMHEVTSTKSIEILLSQVKKCLSYTNDELEDDEYKKLSKNTLNNVNAVWKNTTMYSDEQLLELMDSCIQLLIEPESVNHIWGNYISRLLIRLENAVSTKESKARAIEKLFYFSLHDLLKIYLKDTIFHRAVVAGILNDEKYRHDYKKRPELPSILDGNSDYKAYRPFLVEKTMYANPEQQFYVPDFQTENEVYKELNERIEIGYVSLSWLFADKMVVYTEDFSYEFDNYEAIVEYKKTYEDIFYSKNIQKKYRELSYTYKHLYVPTKDGKNDVPWYGIAFIATQMEKDYKVIERIIEAVNPQSTLKYRWDIHDTRNLLLSLLAFLVGGTILAVVAFLILKGLFILLAPILLGTFLDVLWKLFEAHPIMTVFGLFIILNAFPGPILRGQLSMADIWWIKHS